MTLHDKTKFQCIYCTVYLDRNNLYEWAKDRDFPPGKFAWVHGFLCKFDVNLIGKDCEKSCVLVFDLEKPKQLHDFQSEYPIAPEKIQAEESMILHYWNRI